MKFVAITLAIGAIIFGAFLSPAPAKAALSFEDPQLCVNGKLLMVEPTTAGIEVWVRVGPKLTVDFDVTHCGGNPALPVIAPDHVTYDGPGKRLEGLIHTAKHTDVIVHFDGRTVTLNSGKDEWIHAATTVK
jgi:hypothetical protein